MMKPDWSAKNVRLYKGDCADILPKLSENIADVAITDPPYDFCQETKILHHTNLLRAVKQAIIVFAPPKNQWCGEPDQWLFWLKPISTKNTKIKYSRFIEMIHLYRSIGTMRSGRHWSQYTNIFQDLVDDKSHPFAKPESLLLRLIRNHTDINDIVLDPFMGSGTAGVACVNSGRRFIGIEIESADFENSKLRIQEAIGG